MIAASFVMRKSDGEIHAPVLQSSLSYLGFGAGKNKSTVDIDRTFIRLNDVAACL
jgi:hypothetical protein